MTEVNQEVIKKVIDTYGSDYMLNVCMEECAELIQAISKIRRYGEVETTCRDNLIEEMADVAIIFEELKMLYAISDDDINDWVEQKQQRSLRRIGVYQKVAQIKKR